MKDDEEAYIHARAKILAAGMINGEVAFKFEMTTAQWELLTNCADGDSVCIFLTGDIMNKVVAETIEIRRGMK